MLGPQNQVASMDLKVPCYFLEEIQPAWVNSVGTSLEPGDFGSMLASMNACLSQPLSVSSLLPFLCLPLRTNPSCCVLLQGQREEEVPWAK